MTYSPENVPQSTQDLPRYIQDELTKLQYAVNELYQPEPFHYVGETGEPAFYTNGSGSDWVNYDTSPNVRNLSFYKDSFGRVHLSGLVKTGTIGNFIFTLPEGYRPSEVSGTSGIYFATSCNDNTIPARIEIRGTGDVRPTYGSSVWTSLNGISFRAA